ncbi:hypothetical protein IGI04_039844 [Brassica rapa subsp. trilocularis]|uniref:Uncharacterized protein n=1 Tax=Brassica rapa subsp. trilocularis TaxID=1813537 RepID=A0ABQ7KL20_BRACM|nr:hypothetical protein IGI04_039844 [Brassica rapa subsp. trilocularis]
MTSFFAWNMHGFNMPRKHENSIANYEYHHLGRIWFCWSDQVIVTQLNKTSQIISCAVQNHVTGEQFICSVIYASNYLVDRQTLSADIRATQAAYGHLNMPWIFIDLSATGALFTWWNKHERDPIGKNLDRALVDRDWLRVFPYSQAHFKAGVISNHARCYVRIADRPAVLCDRQNEALVHPSIDSFRIAAEALDRWNHLVAIEEKFYQQKSCVNWLGSPLAGRCMNVKNHRDGNCGCRLDLISAASILRHRDSCVPKPPCFSSHHRRIRDNLAVKRQNLLTPPLLQPLLVLMDLHLPPIITLR